MEVRSNGEVAAEWQMSLEEWREARAPRCRATRNLFSSYQAITVTTTIHHLSIPSQTTMSVPSGLEGGPTCCLAPEGRTEPLGFVGRRGE
jgi:hypothetical protein